jgi:hypothetical protein
MDPKLLDSVTNIIKNKGNQWEPTCISVYTYSGTVNLMDYLLGGKALSPILLLDNAHAGTDPNAKVLYECAFGLRMNFCCQGAI